MGVFFESHWKSNSDSTRSPVEFIPGSAMGLGKPGIVVAIRFRCASVAEPGKNMQIIANLTPTSSLHLHMSGHKVGPNT